MRIVGIIQARVGSTRLPGKVLADIGGQTMLERVVQRVRRSTLINRTIVATTHGPADASVLKQCRALAVDAFCGSEEDVLDRYYKAAQAHNAEAVVRITSDCPLIDPGVIDEVLRLFLAERADYAWNDTPVSYPRGLDVEVMTIEALTQARKEAVEPRERAHVTPFIYRNPELFRIVKLTTGADYSNHRWTVDTAKDLDLVRAVYDRLGSSGDFGWREVLRLLSDEPELMLLNSGVRQKALEEC